MITAKSDVLVFQDIEQVYRFVALDFVANYPRWSPEVISLKALSDGPIQPGYQASQVRVDQGHKTESIFEVVELIAHQRIVFKGVTAPYCSTYEFDNLNASTRLSFTFDLYEVEPRMRPFEKLIRLALQEGVKRTMKKLKILIEKEMLDDD